MTHLIAFAGLARAGKTTAADLAEKRLRERGHDVLRLSFALPLKDGLNCMGIHKDKDPAFYREAAQKLGTDVIRRLRPNHWVERLEDSLPKYACVVLVDDVRFGNESDCISRNHGVLAFIDSGKRLDLSADLYRHESERLALDANRRLRDGYGLGWPTIDNNGPPEALEARVTAFVDEVVNDIAAVF